MQSQTEKALEYDNSEVFEVNHMKSAELLTVVKLTKKFIQTKVFQDGEKLFQEVDCWLSEKQMHRPDLAFFSKEQIFENEVLEYQRAGVKVI
jgi:hypothetical protein